jgi:hypothetical protein
MKIDFARLGEYAVIASAIIYMFTTFVRADEYHASMEDITVRMAIGQFYDRLDDYQEESAEGDTEMANILLQELEELAAEICEHRPKWKYCNKPIGE